MSAGAVQPIVTCESPAVTFIDDGTPGKAAGVIALELIDNVLVPATFVAETLKVYEVPFVSPVNVAVVVADEIVTEPGEEIRV